jgi:hypothetical protein
MRSLISIDADNSGSYSCRTHQAVMDEPGFNEIQVGALCRWTILIPCIMLILVTQINRELSRTA